MCFLFINSIFYSFHRSFQNDILKRVELFSVKAWTGDSAGYGHDGVVLKHGWLGSELSRVGQVVSIFLLVQVVFG